MSGSRALSRGSACEATALQPGIRGARPGAVRAVRPVRAPPAPCAHPASRAGSAARSTPASPAGPAAGSSAHPPAARASRLCSALPSAVAREYLLPRVAPSRKIAGWCPRLGLASAEWLRYCHPCGFFFLLSFSGHPPVGGVVGRWSYFHESSAQSPPHQYPVFFPNRTSPELCAPLCSPHLLKE